MNNHEIPQLHNMEKWVCDINHALNNGAPISINTNDVNLVVNGIITISKAIYDEYPFYASELCIIANNLFTCHFAEWFRINVATFGELFVIIKHLSQEPVNTHFWAMIHPRINKISKSLYCDGYYDSAAEKAVKEVETRLRELFQEIKPGVSVPAKVTDIIGALLSENGNYQFCDTTTTSGKDYRRGIKLLFEGLFAAYRNPSSHANIDCSKRKSFDQITLSSQLMYVLDNNS